MILQQKVKTTWNNKYKNYYESKGYIFTKRGDEFEIDVNDLMPNSKIYINVECDNCHDIYTTQYVVAITRNNGHICKKCQPKIFKKYFMEKYNVENPSQLEYIKEKKRKTCLKNYGVEIPLQAEKIKEKVIQTNLEKYGVTNAFQIEQIKEKTKQANLKKYGVDCALKVNIKERVIKTKKTLYKNDTAPKGKQQIYICNLLNGKLNYPINILSLDVAFPNEMIYIEYDGGGHNLSVKLGKITQEEFNNKERKRQYYLKLLGWKLIRIKSNNDWIPQDEDIIQLINEAKNYLLNSNHSWMEIDIDKKEIRCKEYIKKVEFNNLRKIKSNI